MGRDVILQVIVSREERDAIVEACHMTACRAGTC